MAPADAQVYWMAAKIPNDQFLLYAFAGQPGDIARAVAELVQRARTCPALRTAVEDSGSGLRYPAWVDRGVDDGQIVVHVGDELGWRACLDAVIRLADDQLDLRRMGWRLHVYGPVREVPGAGGPVIVTVVQIAHALGDGMRSATLAGVLFGRAATVYPIARPKHARLIRRSIEAARARRRLDHDTAVGLIPPAGEPRPVLSTNNRPVGTRTLRTLIRSRAELPGPTVTVGVLAAISAALSDYLAARGEDPSMLGAEVPMAKTTVRQAHNHFGNVGVGLHPTVVSRDERAGLIAADLEGRRRRGQHPSHAASDRALAAVPAPLLRWGVRQFDVNARSSIVTGNTVVSSVNRGAADLSFGGCPVILTAGYPALSPMMGLTHGVHGIGDTVAISVHAAESAMSDVDEYVERLDAELR
ncbi:DUF1298 domain-containing protein [Mycobacterium sp.]|jgi:hypothetical protein|uniref:DUF1298 domain-containing protein n=1 Tax=Mycobacterium sp. TaxID=1785 RepID=UPI002D653C30|nr:DUF1298 domain-containing protein [Mycobacterium sp.]HZA11718.1 DUF1298 domain-containing protein [Mycobacterium sp.]